MSDAAQPNGGASRSTPVRQANIRTTIVAVDIAQLVVSMALLVIYGVVVVRGGTAPAELQNAILVMVGTIVGRKLPS